ncbi:HRDC domain-containing protein [Brevibacterium litoralis]|uniref:HRDC domain-containing protein n=1 Tax=Brevibacterium litoralis TaxID=3138935 RepID=UPI0032EF4519
MSSTVAPEDADLPLLASPAGGLPEVVDTVPRLRVAAKRLENGTGPVAVDAERASGIRYGHRAMLVQLKREGAGIVLVDPEALPDLSLLDEALRGTEWILHAATQDLPCLAERGMHPDALFDTEVAARLLGWERFGLAAVVARTLGLRLAKEHSHVDWSQRPLDPAWVEYAALDVEVLIEVADIMQEMLLDAGRGEWAQQEFDALLDFEPRTYTDPWRRTAGMGKIRSRRVLGRLREVWQLRDETARARDVAPSKLIRDRDMVELVGLRISSPDDLRQTHAGRSLSAAGRRRVFMAIKHADALPETDLPPKRSPDSDPRPQVDRNTARDRLEVMKAAVAGVAEDLGLAHDVLLTPSLLKRLAARTNVGRPSDVSRFLRTEGARPWQAERVSGPIARAVEALER